MQMFADFLTLKRAFDTLKTELKNAHQARTHAIQQSRTDALTGLINRFGFTASLNEHLLLPLDINQSVALFIIDLDRFKTINDTMGHAAGDHLLKTMAIRFKEMVRATDVVARLGGDEFAIIARINSTDDTIPTLSKRIAQALAEPVRFNQVLLHSGGSIGIARYPQDATDAPTLQRYADMALYQSKTAARGTWTQFNTKLKNTIERRHILEIELKRALDGQEIEAYFQPIVSPSGQVQSLETLARWHHPELGIISPVEFISLAEDLGVLEELDQQMFHMACKTAAPWVKEGLIKSVAINVSPRQIKATDFSKQLLARLEKTDLPPSALTVEITETSLVEEIELATRHILRLRRHGIKVALDDFGTGYSNLKALVNLPISALKIDKSIVEEVGFNDRATKMFRALVQTTQLLEMDLIAEGVETEEQMIYLANTGCKLMQGYHFSRPKCASDMDTWLRQRASENQSQTVPKPEPAPVERRLFGGF